MIICTWLNFIKYISIQYNTISSYHFHTSKIIIKKLAALCQTPTSIHLLQTTIYQYLERLLSYSWSSFQHIWRDASTSPTIDIHVIRVTDRKWKTLKKTIISLSPISSSVFSCWIALLKPIFLIPSLSWCQENLRTDTWRYFCPFLFSCNKQSGTHIFTLSASFRPPIWLIYLLLSFQLIQILRISKVLLNYFFLSIIIN